jgi:hypothetical protein
VTPARIEEFARDRGALVARVTDHREIESEEAVDVSFADPDEAVVERVRELGLSDAARQIDETIRASKIADSNVSDEVERRVRTLLDDADENSFGEQRDTEPVESADSPPAQPESTDGGTTTADADSSDADDANDDGQVTMEDYS